MSALPELYKYEEILERLRKLLGLEVFAGIEHMRTLPTSDPQIKLHGVLGHREMPEQVIQSYGELLAYNRDNAQDKEYYEKLKERVDNPTEKELIETRIRNLEEVIKTVENHIKGKEELMAPFHKPLLPKVIAKYSPSQDAEELLAIQLGGEGVSQYRPPQLPQQQALPERVTQGVPGNAPRNNSPPKPQRRKRGKKRVDEA